MSSDSNPRRHPDTAFRPVADEGGLVVIPGRSEVKVLNPVGIKVYQLLDGEHSVEQIITAVTAEFEVSTEDAARDVNDFIDLLKEHGLLAAPGERAPWEAEV